MQCVRELWKQARAKSTTLEQWKHLQSQLRIGWGSARVAVGMAVGQNIFEAIKNW